MEGLPFYRQRWFRIALPVAGVGLAYLLMHYKQPKETAAGWMVDLLALGMMFMGTLALASQYILPVRTLRERQGATDRLFLYVSGGHGPIVFVRDGELVATAKELRRKGAGVILVDGSSGVVLEKGRQYSRACGPGIVFMAAGERIHAALDLRRQARSQSSQALTRDGIELKAEVSVVFALDPGETDSLPIGGGEAQAETSFLGQTQITPAFPFRPQNAFKAVYGGAVTEKAELKWADLPIIVATELFRDQVSRLTLDDLFDPQAAESAPVVALQARLTKQVQGAALLRERGIKVYSASVGALELAESVTAQRVRSWAAHWQKQAFTTLAKADVEVERITEKARAEAQIEIIEQFKLMQDALVDEGSSVPRQEIAQKLITGLDRVASDPVTQMLISSDTAKQLANLRHWVGLPADDGELHRGETVKVIGQVTLSEDLSEVSAIELKALEAGEVELPAATQGQATGEGDMPANSGRTLPAAPEEKSP